MFVFDPSQIRAQNHPKYPCWKYVTPLPSAELMGIVGAPDIENFLIVGESWAQVITRFLKPGDAILDIGCGCGRTARFLINFPDVLYIGFDIFKPSIEWCILVLTPLNKRFQFDHFDGISPCYNPNGSLNPRQYRFPADNESIHMAIGASIFTHLKEPDAKHYLEETHRILRAGGKAVFSIHVNPADGKLFTGNEDRIDIDPDYFILMSEKAGLPLKEKIGDLCGQETFVFEKPGARKGWFPFRRKNR